MKIQEEEEEEERGRSRRRKRRRTEYDAASESMLSATTLSGLSVYSSNNTTNEQQELQVTSWIEDRVSQRRVFSDNLLQKSPSNKQQATASKQ